MARTKNNQQAFDKRIKANGKETPNIDSLENRALNMLADIALVELLKIYPRGKVSKK
jgi:hypothetical protein